MMCCDMRCCDAILIPIFINWIRSCLIRRSSESLCALSPQSNLTEVSEILTGELTEMQWAWYSKIK